MGSVTGASTVESRIAASPSEALPRYMSIHMKLTTRPRGMLYSITMPAMISKSEKMSPPARRARCGHDHDGRHEDRDELARMAERVHDLAQRGV